MNIFKEDEYVTGSKKILLKLYILQALLEVTLLKIFLSRENAALQGKVLAKIVSSFIGNKRLPMLAIDSLDNYKKNNTFSARSAAIRGFSYFAKKNIICSKGRCNFRRQ